MRQLAIGQLRQGWSVATRWRLSLIATLAIVLVVPVLVWLAVPEEAFRLCFRHFSLPAYERSLGFQVGDLVLPDSSHAFGIRTVRHAGTFERLGFRPQDALFGYVHGAELGFYHDLRSASREPRRIRVVNVAAGEWGNDRSIVLRLPTPPE